MKNGKNYQPQRLNHVIRELYARNREKQLQMQFLFHENALLHKYMQNWQITSSISTVGTALLLLRHQETCAEEFHSG